MVSNGDGRFYADDTGLHDILPPNPRASQPLSARPHRRTDLSGAVLVDFDGLVDDGLAQ